MKKFAGALRYPSLLVVLLLLFICSARTSEAQVIQTEPQRGRGDAERIWPPRPLHNPGFLVQKAHCVAATSCTLPRSVEPGDMLVVIDALPPVTTAIVSDDQGDFFNQIYTTGWGGFGDPGPMWYATGVFGGNVTIHLSAKTMDIFVAEYPPAALDQISQQTVLCCQVSATVGPLTVKNPDNLLITWVIFGKNASIPASSGFTMEDDGTSIAVEDARVVAGTYGATLPQVPFAAWGARMVSFRLLGPEFSKYKAPYSPIQVKTCARGADGFVLPCQFDAPVQGGSMLVVAAANWGCGAIPGCNSVSDSQSNGWNIATVIPDDGGIPLWYALNAKEGSDTVYFAPNTARIAIIAEYPASLGLEDANYYRYHEPIFHQPNGDQTTLHVTSPVQTRGPCDLLIAWDTSGTQNADAEPGVNFNLRTYDEAANLALEDATSGPPGAYIASISWTSVGHWDMGIAAFNLGGCK